MALTGIRYQEEKSWITETWPFSNFRIRSGILLHCVTSTVIVWHWRSVIQSKIMFRKINAAKIVEIHPINLHPTFQYLWFTLWNQTFFRWPPRKTIQVNSTVPFYRVGNKHMFSKSKCWVQIKGVLIKINALALWIVINNCKDSLSLFSLWIRPCPCREKYMLWNCILPMSYFCDWGLELCFQLQCRNSNLLVNVILPKQWKFWIFIGHIPLYEN